MEATGVGPVRARSQTNDYRRNSGALEGAAGSSTHPRPKPVTMEALQSGHSNRSPDQTVAGIVAVRASRTENEFSTHRMDREHGKQTGVIWLMGFFLSPYTGPTAGSSKGPNSGLQDNLMTRCIAP